jgi:hypothetical protein
MYAGGSILMAQRSTTAGIFADPRDGIMIRFENNRVRKITNDERRLIVAALAPPARQRGENLDGSTSGDLTEAKAVHKLRHLLNHMPDKDFHLPRGEAYDLLRYVDALRLSALPGRDEEAIRADERERCAKVAAEFGAGGKLRSSYGGSDIAAAIRSLKTGSDR